MPGYALLMKYTNQGVAKIKDSPARIEQAKAAAEKMGINVVGVWVTLGEYDLLVVADAPNDHVVGTFALGLASLGNVTTQTMRAFSEDEFKEIVRKLP